MIHARKHWTQTSCLCECHYALTLADTACTDADCAKTIRSQAKPVTAKAAEPMIGIDTPLGRTRRFIA